MKLIFEENFIPRCALKPFKCINGYQAHYFTQPKQPNDK